MSFEDDRPKGRVPVRPPRPSTLYIDSHHGFYENENYAYYPAEDLDSHLDEEEQNHSEHEAANASGNDSETGGTVRYNILDAHEMPASVRSFSRDSNGFNLALANGSAEAFYSVNADSQLTERRRCILNQGTSDPPSPPTTPYGGSLVLTRSRSALASPPIYAATLSPGSPTETVVGSPNGSQTSLVKHKVSARRHKSTALLDPSKIEKPWLEKREFRQYLSYWLSWSMIFLCAGASALIGLASTRNVQTVGKLCLVLEDDFDNGLDRNVWFHEVDMGGFGNKEFEMTTSSENNTFVRDGILYIVPTLTEDAIGERAIFDGYTYNITGCTNANLTHCGVVSNATIKSVIPPVQSARITTRYSHSIRYGRVEIRARLPRGDWLWPALWMLPRDNEYGPWPVSGEIDIMESRGNGPEYPFQGRRYVRSSLNWGPVDFINSAAKTFGWWTRRRQDFSDDFHTYVLEWTPEFLNCYVDSPRNRILSLTFDISFYQRGDYPATAQNGTNQIILQDPWAISGANSAPFDKDFYLIMNVAVGGRNGWFPDTLGGKMWFDGSETAMYDFAKAKNEWYPTWPEDVTRRGMAIDYVKMWQKC